MARHDSNTTTDILTDKRKQALDSKPTQERERKSDSPLSLKGRKKVLISHGVIYQARDYRSILGILGIACDKDEVSFI